MSKLRVLVADDDRDTTVMLAAILRHEAHEVHTALRGDEVLNLERLTRPDVLILDINMPGMSGYAVAHEIRQRRVPVVPLMIAISGMWTQPSERSLAEEMGFDHYLLKPCDPAQLLALLRSFQRSAQEPGRQAG